MILKRLRNPKGKNFSKYHESKAKKCLRYYSMKLKLLRYTKVFFQNINLTSTVKNQKQNK